MPPCRNARAQLRMPPTKTTAKRSRRTTPRIRRASKRPPGPRASVASRYRWRTCLLCPAMRSAARRCCSRSMPSYTCSAAPAQGRSSICSAARCHCGPTALFWLFSHCLAERWSYPRYWSAMTRDRRTSEGATLARGYLSLVLHAHLPFVRHPEYERFLEETWLFEAITDTYIPLLRVFDGLAADGVPFRLTVSISPTLITMLQDTFLQDRYLAHLGKMEALGDKEILRNHGDPRLLEAARMYRRLLHETREWYEDRYRRDLVGAFRRLQDAGFLELATASATHGFLPILKTQPAAVHAQLTVAAQCYRRAFGRDVPGFWLPECGYYPGLEQIVSEVGGRFFFVETHGIMNAAPKPRYGYLAPLGCGDDLAAF